MEKILRDNTGKEVGRISKSGHFLILKNASGKELGRYNTKNEVTYDAKGKEVGRGNLLGYLVGL